MEKNENPNLRTELGFGRYRDKKIGDFDNTESEYLLWALKTVRIPIPLWEAILQHLDTKVIVNTETIIADKSDFDEDYLEKISKTIELDKTRFLEPRIEPNNLYECDNCKALVPGYPEQGYISDIIRCNNCEDVLDLNNSELRFYFGWYRGWRISDFETPEDKEYLKWIIENIRSLTPGFKSGILKKLRE